MITWIGCDPANFAVGRGGHSILGICVHLMDGSLVGTDAWFNTSPADRKNGNFASSAHYGIGRAGQVHQYVLETDRAYHAGRVLSPTAPIVLAHPGVNPNDFLIGVEHEGHINDDWPEEMVQASAALIADICTRYSIPITADNIVRHHAIFAGKPCPGPRAPVDEIILEAQRIAGGDTLHQVTA